MAKLLLLSQAAVILISKIISFLYNFIPKNTIFVKN